MSVGTPTPTVFLVDDDTSVLRATERLIRSAGFSVSAFHSPEEFLQQLNPAQSGCLVLDVTMPKLDGFQIQKQLASIANQLPILFLSGTGDVPIGVHAMKLGAVDFLSKPCPDDVLLDAIRRALAIDEQARTISSVHAATAALFAALTPREHQVMLGVVAGKPNKVIAADLGAMEQTIKIHRARVMQKLHTKSLADLVRLAQRAGLGPIS